MISTRTAALAAALTLSMASCAERRASREAAPPPAAIATSGGARSTASARTLMWRIEHRGRVSHLLGTLHVGVSMRDALGDVGASSLDQSSTVYVEAMLDAALVRESLVSALIRAQLPEGERLRTLLGEEDFVKVTALLQNFPPAAIDRLEPSLVAVFALGASMSRRPPSSSDGEAVVTADAGATPVVAAPMDSQIIEHARQRRMQVRELESISDQFNAFAGLGRETSIAMLRSMVRNPETNTRVAAAMAEAYRSASAEEDVAALVRALSALSPTFVRMLLDDRNDRWMPAIERAVQAGGAFIAVGAAHTVGPKGLVASLRARGYTVERVRTTNETAAATGVEETRADPRR